MLSFSPAYVRPLVLGLFLICWLWWEFDLLKYAELSAARRALSRKAVRRQVKEELYLQQLDESVEKADSPESCWQRGVQGVWRDALRFL